MSAAPLKILCLFGTRPEAIKMAPLILAMRKDPDRFHAVVAVTGQHREMLDQVLTSFDIRPDFDLDVMVKSQTLAGMTSKILQLVDEVLTKTSPDVVLVQGDTTTTFAGTLAAFYRSVPVGHVEAGLRTRDLRNPFPEEANRVLVDRLARFCFAPTKNNKETLLKEGIDAERIFVTGNTGIDALLITQEKLKSRSVREWSDLWGSAARAVEDRDRPLVLITLHRRESFGETVRRIFETLRAAAIAHPETEFVYPVHFNPNVLEPARSILGGISNLHLIEPLPYEPFVFLMSRARLILTDSGGIQEEAPSLGKPVIVMRRTTERQEGLHAGTIQLGGTDSAVLLRLIDEALARETPQGASIHNPYGDGTAAAKILHHLWANFRRE